MKTKSTAFWLFLMLLGFHSQVQAQDTIRQQSFSPGGAPFVKIFSNFHTDVETENTAFEVTRAYFGYDYALSRHFSSKLTLDVGSPVVEINDSTAANTSLQMTAYLKTASLDYKTEKFEASFGLIGLKQHKLPEKFWGHRYIFKTLEDEHKISSSADLGLWVTYKPFDFLDIEGMVRNGEGYKQLQSDNVYRYGTAFTLSVWNDFVLRGYYDYSKNEEVLSTISHFVGYSGDALTLGTGYNIQQNQQFIGANDISGLSVFGRYDINKTLEVFARYDQLEYHLSGQESGEQWIGGVQVAPVNGVLFALNYQGWIPEVGSLDQQHYIYLNCQVAF